MRRLAPSVFGGPGVETNGAPRPPGAPTLPAVLIRSNNERQNADHAAPRGEQGHVALLDCAALLDRAVPKDKQACADRAARLVRLARTPAMG